MPNGSLTRVEFNDIFVFQYYAAASFRPQILPIIFFAQNIGRRPMIRLDHQRKSFRFG